MAARSSQQSSGSDPEDPAPTVQGSAHFTDVGLMAARGAADGVPHQPIRSRAGDQTDVHQTNNRRPTPAQQVARRQGWLQAWPEARKLRACIRLPASEAPISASITALDCRKRGAESNNDAWPVLDHAPSKEQTGIDQVPLGKPHPPMIVLVQKSEMLSYVRDPDLREKLDRYPQDAIPMTVITLFKIMGIDTKNSWTKLENNPFFWLDIDGTTMIVQHYFEQVLTPADPPQRRARRQPMPGAEPSVSTAASTPAFPQEQANRSDLDARVNPEADNAGRRVAQRTTANAGPSRVSRAGPVGEGAEPARQESPRTPSPPPPAVPEANPQNPPVQNGRAVQAEEDVLASVRQGTPGFYARVAALRQPIDQAEAQFNGALAALAAAESEQAAAREQLSQCQQSEQQINTQLWAQMQAHRDALNDILSSPNVSVSHERRDRRQAIWAQEDELYRQLSEAKASVQAAQNRLREAEGNIGRIGTEAYNLMRTLLP